MINSSEITTNLQKIIPNSKVMVNTANQDCVFIIIEHFEEIKKNITDKINSELQNILSNKKFKIAYVQNTTLNKSLSNSTSALEKSEAQNEKKNTKNLNKKSKRKIDNISKIILIASGKGGVGKSTIATNLALSLAQLGWRVGLLDADIYGASIPTIFGISNHQIELDEKTMMIPVEIHNIKINSIEFITKSDEALIWRGPMISKVLQQLIQNTNWGELDYLIIDTPPGTGDIHITLLENYEIDGYILVSTPHQTSINNSYKTKSMFERFNVPNLAFVLNLAWLESKENNQQKIFQNGELSKLDCTNNKIEIPFIINQSDQLFALNENHSKKFVELARKVVSELI